MFTLRMVEEAGSFDGEAPVAVPIGLQHVEQYARIPPLEAETEEQEGRLRIGQLSRDVSWQRGRPPHDIDKEFEEVGLS